MLIRTTLVALHQANVTGNYSVLRDLGASVLQSANSAADLAAEFVDFREKRSGLAQAVLVDPILDEGPMLSSDGVLRLIGHCPTTPQEIVFDLTFLYEGGDWRLAQISVATRVRATEARRASTEAGRRMEATPGDVPVPRLRTSP